MFSPTSQASRVLISAPPFLTTALYLHGRVTVVGGKSTVVPPVITFRIVSVRTALLKLPFVVSASLLSAVPLAVEQIWMIWFGLIEAFCWVTSPSIWKALPEMFARAWLRIWIFGSTKPNVPSTAETVSGNRHAAAARAAATQVGRIDHPPAVPEGGAAPA